MAQLPLIPTAASPAFEEGARPAPLRRHHIHYPFQG